MTSSMTARREAAGLSFAHVADSLSRHPATVQRWESGATMPSRTVLVRLAALYGCTPAELVAD